MLSKEVCAPSCSIAKMHSSPATIRARRTGPALLRSSKLANCTASIRKPTSPTCSPSSSICGPPRISTNSCPGPGRPSAPPGSPRNSESRRSLSKKSSRQSRATRRPLTIDLFRLAVNELVEQRHTVGLCPQSDSSGVAEGRIFDLEQLFAVVEHAKAVALEVDAEAKPLVGRDRNVDAVSTLPAVDVERAADAVDGLVQHDVVLERIRARDIVIVGILGTPHDAGRAILRARDGLELNLDETIPHARGVLE